MTHAGWDHDGLAFGQFDDFIIKLHLCIRPAFQDVVGFGERFVVVQLRIFGDLCDMQRAGKLRDASEGTSGSSAWAWDPGNTGEVGDIAYGADIGGLLCGSGAMSSLDWFRKQQTVARPTPVKGIGRS